MNDKMDADQKPQPEVTDNLLDELLKDIAVPTDLTAALLQIVEPETELVEIDNPINSRSWQRVLTALALAASLIGIAAFGSWYELSKRRSTLVVEESYVESRGSNVKEQTLAAAESLEVVEAKQLMNEILNIERQVVEMLAESEYAETERTLRLAKIENLEHLSQFETQSMIFALGDQAVIPLGGSLELATSDMTNVIQMFPGSRGSELAEQFLKNQN